MVKKLYIHVEIWSVVMTYSYSAPINYNPQSYPQQNNASSQIVALGSLLGGTTGCVIGCLKNPCKSVLLFIKN